jgi:hypothetical protein
MLPPRAAHLVIRHFDSIDAFVSRHLVAKRPLGETALTSILCQLLDDEYQSLYNLTYPLKALNQDLAGDGSLIRLSYQVETHEYDARVERWVTQADLGLVINYRDYLSYRKSWSLAWLLQAKRLSAEARGALRYTEASRFGGIDRKQEERLKRLRDVVGVDFIRHLLYCPRPSVLDSGTRGKLSYLRVEELSDGIFDYAVGLEIHGDLSSETPTLEAGIFLSHLDDMPPNLGRLHQGTLSRYCPLSWFMVQCFTSSAGRRGPVPRPLPPMGGDGPGIIGGNRPVSLSPDSSLPAAVTPQPGSAEWAHGLVRGNGAAIAGLIRSLDIPQNGEFRFLPAHTIVIDIRVGHDLDPDQRSLAI